MKVYVVFHDDIEDSKWVRGVFSTREAAQRVADSIEPCAEDHRHTYGARECGPIECWKADDHFTRRGTSPSLCCGVEEWDLLD